MLTKIEVVDFLTNVLEIPEVLELLINQDRHYTIDVIMESYREQIPFQNITTLAVDFGKKSRPSWSDIKDAMFSKQGGRCYSHQVFMFALLTALDYDMSLALSTCGSSIKHVLLFIKNLEKSGDTFLLEAGLGLPCFHLIPLDFVNESQIYFDSFLEYKYIKHNKRIVRMHRKGDPRSPEDVKNQLIIDGWIRYYEFDFESETKNYRDFDKEFDFGYTDPRATPFHSIFYFTTFKNKKAITIYNNKLLTENENNEIDKTTLETDEDVVKKILELSSSFIEKDILAAIHNYKLRN